MSRYSLRPGLFDAGRAPCDQAPPPLLTRPHVQVSSGNLDDSSTRAPTFVCRTHDDHTRISVNVDLSVVDLSGLRRWFITLVGIPPCQQI
jgi:hypothetical protein